MSISYSKSYVLDYARPNGNAKYAGRSVSCSSLPSISIAFGPRNTPLKRPRFLCSVDLIYQRPLFTPRLQLGRPTNCRRANNFGLCKWLHFRRRLRGSTHEQDSSSDMSRLELTRSITPNLSSLNSIFRKPSFDFPTWLPASEMLWPLVVADFQC